MTGMEETLETIGKTDATLLELPAERFNQSQKDLVRELVDKHGKAVIISVTRPGKKVLEELTEAGIYEKDISIIDTVTKTQQKKVEDQKSIHYISNPSSLTEPSISLDKELKSGGTVLLLDSVNSLLIHNKQRILKKFVHGVLTKSRLKDIPAVLLAAEGRLPEDLKADIAQLCDRTLTMD